MSEPSSEESAGWGWRSDGESRWPATIAIVAVIVLQALAPERLVIGPRYVMQGVEAVLLLALIAGNPSKLDKVSRDLRWLSMTLIVVLTVVNLAQLSELLNLMLTTDLQNGRALIQSAVSIWAVNILAFGLWFWETDRGGPLGRTKDEHRAPGFLFPQMSDPESAPHRWVPKFVDYMYVAFTNALAFSPTDTMPLTRAAKALMAAESLISLATIVVVGARAVNILS